MKNDINKIEIIDEVLENCYTNEHYELDDVIEKLEEFKKAQNQGQLLPIDNVRLSLPDDAIHFAEWMDIVCIRDGRFDWKYNADNYTKKHTTKEMFTEWLKLTSNEV